MLMLPKELIAEYAAQPDSVVSVTTYMRESMHAAFTMFNEDVLENRDINKSVIRSELNQKLQDKMDAVNEELVLAIKDHFTSRTNADDEVEFNVWGGVLKILTRTSNRIFAGASLCRQESYIDAVLHFAGNMFPVAVLIGFVPKFLRPYVSINPCIEGAFLTVMLGCLVP